MREIKFRAWHEIDKKWLHGYCEHGWGCSIFGEVIVMGNWLSECHGLMDQNNVTVEQYTGLHDKNGRDIYEGDICRFNLQDFNGGDHIRALQVVYVVDMFGFPYKSEPMIDDPDCCISLGEVVANDDEVEVIGNIHENPELIKLH